MASFSRRWIGVSAVLFVLIGLGPNPAQADRDRERETFQAGWAAAARGDQAGTLEAILALEHYPLTPYLEFELLRQRIDRVPEAVMEQFLARHRDWSFATGLERSWLRSLGRRGEYAALDRHGRGSQDIEVRCHLARADLEAGRTDGLWERVESLWLSGRSRPSACDSLFNAWRLRGNPSTELAWQRFHLAMDAGEHGLARYLRRYLDRDQRYWADRWIRLAEQPWRALREAREWPDHEITRERLTESIRRLARSDHERADRAWSMHAQRFDFSDHQRQAIERELALFMAVALETDAVAAIDNLAPEARDQQVLEWRARAAMAHGDWGEVLASIESMPLSGQGQGRWRYWRGRALAELGRADAALAFASLSSEATYYGFLAALRLNQGLTLCADSLSADAAVQRRLMRDAEFERALELHRVGLNWNARWTWARVASRLSQTELEQAALLAAGQAWHGRAIHALSRAGNRRAYAWRFPMLARGEVDAATRRWEVDPALVYGLMRAESAMQTDALSPAGARGLLQLMPGTAREVARRKNLSYNGQGELMNPAVNIPLGVAHLAELEARFDGNWVHVAAAYNAGISAVERWLDSRPFSDPDVWLETLPFYETRDYVPRVLAFATIYEWQLQREPEVLGRFLLPQRNSEPRQFACAD